MEHLRIATYCCSFNHRFALRYSKVIQLFIAFKPVRRRVNQVDLLQALHIAEQKLFSVRCAARLWRFSSTVSRTPFWRYQSVCYLLHAFLLDSKYLVSSLNLRRARRSIVCHALGTVVDHYVSILFIRFNPPLGDVKDLIRLEDWL